MVTRSEEAFRRHYAQLFRFVRRRTPDDLEAEEVTQAVFADAARSLDDFKPGAPPILAWLYTVAQRRLADRARRLTLQRASLSKIEQTRVAVASQEEYGAELAAALRAAIALLPETQRNVVVMKLLNGLSFAEIASRVGAGEAACKIRFARGLDSIRDELSRAGVKP